MTINLSDNSPRVTYTVAAGVTQSSFTVPFDFFEEGDVNVYVDGVLKTITTDYTITGGSGTGGTVLMSVTGISGGSSVVLTRDVALERTTDFPTSGPFDVSSLNNELDKIIAVQADLKSRVDRSIQATDYDEDASIYLPSKNDRKGKVLAFNASTGNVEVGATVSGVAALSAVTNDIETLADIEDGTIATDAISGLAAISSNVNTVASNITNVSNVGTNILHVENVSNNMLSVTSAVTNAATANAALATFQQSFNSGASAPASPTDGDLWYDTANSQLRVYVASTSQWEIAGSYLDALTSTHVFTATAGQTTFTTDDDGNALSIYTNGNTFVYKNGVRLTIGTSSTNDYHINGNVIYLNAGANLNDVILVEVFTKFTAVQEASLDQKVTDATTQATNAAASASSAATSLSNIGSAESNAAASASAALVSANSASTSESNASSSATAAAASATSVGNDATQTAADAVATAADRVQTGLDRTATSASAAAALVSENAAASDASQVATDAAQVAADKIATAADRVQTGQDATSASNSATSASNSASTATTQASLATTNGAAQVALATTQATNASNSASASATSATAAANSATSASNSESAASTSESNASTSESNAALSASAAATSASNAATSESNAATSETNSAASATASAASATSSSASSTSAASAQAAAESARDSALAAFDSFDDRYLGVFSSNPSTDNDGNALVAGSLYFNSASSAMQVYTGSGWTAAYVSGTGFASLSGASFTGDITVPNIILSGTIDGRDPSADGTKLDGIEAGATGDQTASEIMTAIQTVDGATSGLDADLLDGQEGSYYLDYNNATNTPTIPTNNNQLTNGAGYITSVPAQSFSSLTGKPTTIAGYGITDAFDGAYGSLTGTPTIPTNNSELTNGAGYITSVPAQSFASLTSKPTTISGYGITDAFDGAYSSLTGLPTIPTNNNQLSNGAGYVTSSGVTSVATSGGLTGGTITGTGTISVDWDVRPNLNQYFGNNGGEYTIYDNSNALIRFYINSVERFRMVSNGDFHADGDVIAYSTTISDERLKTDITKIDSALEKVGQLNGYTFTYKADGKQSAGVIAQEVEKILPSAVSEKELPLKTDDGVAYKTVQYDQLVGLLIEAVNELTNRVKELEAKHGND